MVTTSGSGRMQRSHVILQRWGMSAREEEGSGNTGGTRGRGMWAVGKQEGGAGSKRWPLDKQSGLWVGGPPG